MSMRLYDMRELIDDIQWPYAQMLPDWDDVKGCAPRWGMDEAYQMLMNPPSEEWHERVLNRLKRCDYLVPDYVSHELTEYLRANDVIGVFEA